MKEEDWDLIFRVHVKGAFKVTHAAWPYMREQNYGRIIMTCSGSGLYGNFGQTNYSAAKLSLLGFASSLSQEGQSKNILVNTIAPIAASRMTNNVLPSNLFPHLTPESVSGLVAYLCHESSSETGGLFEVASGWVSRVRWERTRGGYLSLKPTPEEIRDNWNTINDWKNSVNPSALRDSLACVIENLERHKTNAKL